MTSIDPNTQTPTPRLNRDLKPRIPFIYTISPTYTSTLLPSSQFLISYPRNKRNSISFLSQTAMLDPYTASASMTSVDTKEKIEGLKEIIDSTHTAMLTTRSKEGHLHSRAMAPASSKEDKDLKFIFIANNASHKFEELRQDSNVNVAFLNPSTTAWASICGKAQVINNRDIVYKYWSKGTEAWFGDLGDGVHKGDASDPRVSLIEVVPEQIRYWYPTEGKVMRAVEIGYDTLTGGVATPGEIRTLSPKEMRHHD